MPAYSLRITTTGSAGSAAGSADSEPVEGILEAVKIDYTSMPASTDVTLTELSAPARTLLTIADANTDDVFYPTMTEDDASGVAQTTRRPFYVSGRLRASAAQADAGVIVVTLVIRAAEGARQ